VPPGYPLVKHACQHDTNLRFLDERFHVSHALAVAVGDDTGPVILVHGGAGARAHDLTSSEEFSAHAALRRAIEAGRRVLLDGGHAVDAVCAAVQELEDAPDFNAARGAALTATGTAELDACVMDGSGRAGAVTGVDDIKNPVWAARAVMEHTPHVLLASPSPELIAQWGLQRVDPAYFVTERRMRELAEYRSAPDPLLQHGTVGAVARDAGGRVAAATSTGGVVNQLVGRIGDTPLVGSGTFADDATVAVSCTGMGEAFIAEVAAFRVHSLIELASLDATAAATTTLDRVAARGGTGGMIVVPHGGRAVIAYNSGAMFFGHGTAAEVKTHV
jgi:beta-aspartyl-peptidase (threonine type)